MKKDLIVLKKTIDKEKEGQLKKQAEELESLKAMMKNKAAQDEERKELSALREQMAAL